MKPCDVRKLATKVHHSSAIFPLLRTEICLQTSRPVSDGSPCGFGTMPHGISIGQRSVSADCILRGSAPRPSGLTPALPPAPQSAHLAHSFVTSGSSPTYLSVTISGAILRAFRTLRVHGPTASWIRQFATGRLSTPDKNHRLYHPQAGERNTILVCAVRHGIIPFAVTLEHLFQLIVRRNFGGFFVGVRLIIRHRSVTLSGTICVVVRPGIRL